MSRLIDADDVKKRGDCYPLEIRSVISNILRHTKTIKDVAPVRHGHWIYHDSPAFHWKNQCSQCNSWSANDTNYCAFCGCKMDEVINDG